MLSMIKKAAAGILAAVLCLAIFAGCSESGDISSGPAAKDYPVTVGSVTLNKKPEGVVVLSQNLADVLLATNNEILLKGKSADCTQADLSVLADMTIDQVDAIKNAGANLVLVDAEPSETQRKALQDAGIQVAVLKPAASREDLERLYTEVGSLMQGGNTGYTKAQRASESILMAVDSLTRMVPDNKKNAVACYLYDLNGMVATGDTMAGKLIEYAGMTNNFSGWTGGKVESQPAEAGDPLTNGDPDYIFCEVGLRELILQDTRYQNVKAVMNKNVYEISSTYMNRQGNTMVEAVALMAGRLEPSILEGTSPSSGTTSTTSSGSTASAASSTASSTPSSGATSSSSSADTPSSVPPAKVAQEGILQKGDTGPEVVKLQQRLDELGYMNYGKVTGEFTGSTEQFVKDFQVTNYSVENGITEVSGIADANTLKLLYSDNAKRAEGS